MPTFSDYVAANTSGTADTETNLGTIAVPGGSTITKIVATSYTVGVVYAVRLEFPGIQTPKKFLFPVAYHTQGTEIGHGEMVGCSLDVAIAVPGNVSQVTVYATADVATTPARVALEWQPGGGGDIFADYCANATNTAGTEFLVGTISVKPGGRIRRIVASGVGAGATAAGGLWSVRLDAPGIKSPQKYVFPWYYGLGGTPAGPGVEENEKLIKDVDVEIPVNISTMNVYAISTISSTYAKVGLMWV